jgi:hypothetical protein
MTGSIAPAPAPILKNVVSRVSTYLRIVIQRELGYGDWKLGDREDASGLWGVCAGVECKRVARGSTGGGQWHPAKKTGGW